MYNDFSISDAELIYMFHQGCCDTFDLLLKYYNRLLWKRSHASHQQGSMDSVELEDFYQVASISFYESLYSFRPEVKVGLAHFVDICIKSGLGNMTRKCRTFSYQLLSSKHSLDNYLNLENTITFHDVLYEDDIRNDPADMAIYEEVVEYRSQFVGSLKSVEQDIFYSHLEGFSYKEIADLHNVESKDVDNVVQKVRRRLKLEFNS